MEHSLDIEELRTQMATERLAREQGDDRCMDNVRDLINEERCGADPVSREKYKRVGNPIAWANPTGGGTVEDNDFARMRDNSSKHWTWVFPAGGGFILLLCLLSRWRSLRKEREEQVIEAPRVSTPDTQRFSYKAPSAEPVTEEDLKAGWLGARKLVDQLRVQARGDTLVACLADSGVVQQMQQDLNDERQQRSSKIQEEAKQREETCLVILKLGSTERDRDILSQISTVSEEIMAGIL
eukprot:Skav232710  [mRNA]  locus=scaffold3459:129326:150782:- [translate_table: standard]